MDNRMQRIVVEICSVSLVIAIVAIIVSIFAGCKEIRYVSVPEYHHDTIQVYNTRIDSVRMYDSISVKMKNDTLYIEKIKYRDRYHKLYDSVYVSKTDTITNIQEIEVERKLSAFEKFKIRFGGYAFGFILAIVIGLILYAYFKLKL